MKSSREVEILGLTGFRALVTVRGYELPDPSTYNASVADVVDSGRNAEGRMIGSVIRSDVAKVEVKWRFLRANEWASVTRLFDPARGGSFINSVNFYNQTTAAWETREMYISDRTAGMFRTNPEDGKSMGWVDCRIALVEV